MKKYAYILMLAATVGVSAQTVKMERVTEALHTDGVLYLIGTDPLGATVDLGRDASLIFEALLPSEVSAEMLAKVTVEGRGFDASRDRLSIYGNGSEIIPNGWENPLIIYKEEGCKGESMVCRHDVYYRGKKVADALSWLPQEDIGDFDNAIRSFCLRRGFQVCFANNNDGTGYSRVYTATDADLVVEQMPEGLEFASFIRVCRADRVGKRGIGGSDLVELTRSSWCYDWGAGNISHTDWEYTPMRHNLWWDSWENIGSRTNTSCVLAYNEPDHSDQANLSPDVAISEWDNIMKSGLRAGSPAPDQIEKDWLKRFLATADSLNYRVDFVATHMYWNSQDPRSLCKRIDQLCSETYGGRPMWITEWNNGANWTGEHWPDKTGPARDADFNIIKEDSIVSRPHTEANSKVQCDWLKGALPIFDKSAWLERHGIFNAVEDARAVALGGKLTPAGKIFTDHRSVPGFSHSREYEHKWRIAPPFFISFKAYDNRVYMTFNDHNGETGANYILEERPAGGEWAEVAVILPDVNYKYGKKVTYTHYYTRTGKLEYRVRATSYKGDVSIASRVQTAEAKVASIGDVAALNGLNLRGAKGAIYYSATTPCTVQVYGIDGRTVASLDAVAEERTYPLSPGIYIVTGKKISIW